MPRIALQRRAGLPALLAVAVLISAAGCGTRGTVPLRGTVTLDGRPLAGATVHFFPQDPGGREALGTTDAQGVFRLSTVDLDDGAFPGHYKVTVRPAAEAGPQVAAKSAAEAMEAAAADHKPRRPSVNIPARYSQPGQTVLVQEVPADGDVVFKLQSK